MLNYCLNTFKKVYAEKGDSLILDIYTLNKGIYFYVDLESGEILHEDVVTYENRSDAELLERYARIDDLSTLISANKMAGGNRAFKSNNYLTFWLDSKNLFASDKSLKEDMIEKIEKHYDTILETDKKNLKKSKTKIIYDKFYDEVGEIDTDLLEKCKKWTTENIYSLLDKYKKKKELGDIKIFFNVSLNQYEKESKRYLSPKIFNKDVYNELRDGIVFGLSNSNMGANDKKPLLLNTGRNIEAPYMIELEEALLLYKFFRYLLRLQLSDDRVHDLYITEDELIPIGKEGRLPSDFDGVYLRLGIKSKEAIIIDYEVIEKYTPKINIDIKKVIKNEYLEKYSEGKLSYGVINDIYELKNIIDKVFFSGYLSRNLYAENADFKSQRIDTDLKAKIIREKRAYANWFYKCDDTDARYMFEKTSLESIIKNNIKGKFISAMVKFNLREAILNYFNGGTENMEKKYKDLYDNIVNGLLEGELEFKDKSEYYFFAGQVAFALLNQSGAAKKSMDMIRILETSNASIFKKKFELIYKKYRYKINLNDKIMSTAISTVLDYDIKDGKTDLSALNCGFLYNNSIREANYIKREEKEEAKEII